MGFFSGHFPFKNSARDGGTSGRPTQGAESMRSSTLPTAPAPTALEAILGNIEEARELLMQAMAGADALDEGILHSHIGLSVVQIDDARAILTERTGL